MDALIGVDIGQTRDPTAICAAQIDPRGELGREEFHYLIRFLERLPLGTAYPDVAKRIAQVVHRVRDLTDKLPIVFVDATGVGQPLIDLLRMEEVRARPVYFTHGDKRTVDPRSVKLGKAFLVSRLQVLLQAGRLHLPKNAESEALAQELMDYEIRVDQNATDRYGAFRVGSHDDLITALGLAVQEEPARWNLW